MVRNKPTRIKLLILGPLLSLLIFAVACGGAATSTAIPATTAPVDTGDAPPTATAEPTAGAPAKVVPFGVLRVANKDLGPAQFVTQHMAVPQCQISTSVLFDALWERDPEGRLQKRALEDWSVSEDGLTWTLNIRKDIPFHGGGQWGNYSADDLIWSTTNMLLPESRHPGRPRMVNNWAAEGGSVTKIDDFTVEVNTGDRVAFDFTWSLRQGGASCAAPSVSQKYIESVGIDVANVDAIGTGPWELVEWRTNEIFHTTAVQDHWRQTPFFAELKIFQIPEESTRIANFLAGQLDTMQMALSSLSALVDMPGIKFKRYPGALELRLNIHGQWYVERDDRDFNPVRDPSKAWVSASADVNSPEWEAARKVREALSISIDRQAIVDTLLEGEGSANAVYSHWLGSEAYFDDEMRSKAPEFNVERAKQLLAEAGWADGFDIDMALTQRSYPGAPAMGEAVCLMWQDINVKCNQERTPMTAFRPTFLARSGQGVNTHDNSPSPEPISIIQNIIGSKGLVNMGIEHPRLDELIDEILNTGDTEARFAVARELAKFMEHNVFNIPVVHVNLVWPIGPEIDVWELNCCSRDIASGFEYIPHRSQ